MQSPTLYLDQPSGLHALNPLSKLAISSVFVFAAATLPSSWLVLATYVFGLLPLAYWGKILKPFIKTNAIIIWPFALSLFIIQGLFAPGEQVLLQFGPLSLTVEGISVAWTFTTRILVWLGAATLLMMCTRPDHLMLSLTELGLPRQIAYIVLTAMQIIPRFQGRAQMILDAQQARGLDTSGSLPHRLRQLIPLVSPLIISSLLELDERALALEARGFSRQGPRTSLIQLRDTSRQRWLRWSIMILNLLLLVLWIRSLILP